MKTLLALLAFLLIASGCSAPPQYGVPAPDSADGANPPDSGAPDASASAGAGASASYADAGAVAKNTALSGALAEAGIPNAATDVQVTRILVAFDLPSEMDEEKAAYYAIGAAAGFADNGQQIMVEVFSGDSSTVYSVDSAAVTAYISGASSAEDFAAAVSVS